MKHLHKEVICNYPLISLITQEDLDTLNYICHSHYSKGEVKNQIVIKRKEEKPSFWKTLMEGNRGLDKDV